MYEFKIDSLKKNRKHYIHKRLQRKILITFNKNLNLDTYKTNSLTNLN